MMRNTVESNGNGFFNVASFTNKNQGQLKGQNSQNKKQQHFTEFPANPVVYSNEGSLQNSYRKQENDYAKDQPLK